MPTTLWPSLAISASPCAMPSVPSVATNGGIFSAATRYPFARPKTTPTATAASNPSGIDPVESETRATTIEVSVTTAPIERSNPSVMMTRVMGNDSSNNSVDCTSTLATLGGDRNPGAATAKPTTSSVSTMATPGSRRSELTDIVAATSAMMHPQPHDVFFRQLGARQFTGDAAFAHHIGAVADMTDFGLFGRDHQRSGATGNQPVAQREDLGLGADVDPAGRLVEDEQPGAGGEPLADHDLLLIAARKEGNRLTRARRDDTQFRDQIIRHPRRAPRLE